MLKVAVVDDDKNYLDTIKRYFSQFQSQRGVQCAVDYFTSGMEFIGNYKMAYHLVLLDIEMDYYNGLITAKKLREIDERVIIIFVTNATQYAIEGYKYSVYDYIVKPLSYFDFDTKIQKVLKLIDNNKGQKLLLKLSSGDRCVSTNDIYYIEVRGHQLIIHTKEEQFQIRGTLSKLEEELAPYHFVRSDNCYLINLAYVMEIKNNIVVVGKDQLSISRPKKKKFYEALAEYMGGSR